MALDEAFYAHIYTLMVLWGAKMQYYIFDFEASACFSFFSGTHCRDGPKLPRIGAHLSFDFPTIHFPSQILEHSRPLSLYWRISPNPFVVLQHLAFLDFPVSFCQWNKYDSASHVSRTCVSQSFLCTCHYRPHIAAPPLLPPPSPLCYYHCYHYYRKNQKQATCNCCSNRFSSKETRSQPLAIVIALFVIALPLTPFPCDSTSRKGR